MEHRYLAEPLKCTVSLTCCACFFLLGGAILPLGRWISAAIFFLLGLFFCILGIRCGAVVHLSPDGVRRTVLGRKTAEFLWTDIAEVGVAGTNIFNRRSPDKVGSLYIYVSKTSMTAEEQFDMMLKWPPRGKIYLEYSSNRMHTLQLLWPDKLHTYNVGKLELS